MSSSILHEVIDSLNLKLYVEEVGQVMESRVVTYPFDLKTKFNSDSVYTFSFNISFRDNELIIFDLNKGSLKHSLERLDTNIELRKSIALNAREETNSKFSIDKAAMSEYDDYKLVLGL